MEKRRFSGFEETKKPRRNPRAGFVENVAIERIFSIFVAGHVIPVCLPLDSLSIVQYDGKKLTTVGWGRTSNGEYKKSQNLPIAKEQTIQ